MKRNGYSGRQLSAKRKTELEDAARREGASTSEWLAERRDGDSGDDDEQAAIRKRAVAAIGSICGGDPTRSAGSSELVSEIISRKHAKGVASKP